MQLIWSSQKSKNASIFCKEKNVDKQDLPVIMAAIETACAMITHPVERGDNIHKSLK
jgi:hypothetical protein